MLPFIEKFNQI